MSESKFFAALRRGLPTPHRSPLMLRSKRNLALRSATEQRALQCLTEEEKYYFKEVRGEVPELNAAAPADFYQLLGLDVGATRSDIRTSYKKLLKIIHPDLVGPEANLLAVLMNKAYEILLDDDMRAVYEEEVLAFRKRMSTFDGQPVSMWMGPEQEQRAVFVDETACIGCGNCTLLACRTFQMEPLWGRARVLNQWADEEDVILEAISMCPVDCIYYVKRAQLALLEYVMKLCEREDVAIIRRRLSGNMGPPSASENPFHKAEVFMKYRKEANVNDVEKNLSATIFQDEFLAAAIAKAWLQLPRSVRAQGWQSWVSSDTTA